MSCKKHEKCEGGTGGNLTLKIYLKHHEHTLTNLKNYRDTVYVKYNVREFPGSNPSIYDATFIGEYQEDHVLVSNLKCGQYYLFAVGMESTHFVRVYGGIPFTTLQNDGEVNVTIPVSE